MGGRRDILNSEGAARAARSLSKRVVQMENAHVMQILSAIERGELSARDGYEKLKLSPYEDLGYAKVDHHREVRQGAAEVIYGASKTKEQIEGILESMLSRGLENVLITRLSKEGAEYLSGRFPLFYDPASRVGIANRVERVTARGAIVVATGGTSDIPVAEEAALTAEALGNRVIRLYDVGVAGLHRLLANLETLASATAIVAVAGMEGALASVIGGLCDCPVIGVPTSVGYGASFNGLSALLSMLNSCASGVSVVNIDNGFGAGYLASMINHIGGDL